MSKHKHFRQSSGFTIVELLVVIVVIAILAAVVLVAYGGITSRAREATLQSDLKGASTQLGAENVDNSAYPNDATTIKKSEGTFYQYTYNGGTNDYCLTATTDSPGDKAYHISSDSGTVEEGLCTGHVAVLSGGGADLDGDGSIDGTVSDVGYAEYYNPGYGGETVLLDIEMRGPLSQDPIIINYQTLSVGQLNRWDFYDTLPATDIGDSTVYETVSSANSDITNVKFYMNGIYIGNSEPGVEGTTITSEKWDASGEYFYLTMYFVIPAPSATPWDAQKKYDFFSNGRVDFTYGGKDYSVYVIGQQGTLPCTVDCPILL